MKNAIVLLNYESAELIENFCTKFVTSNLRRSFVLIIVDNSPGLLSNIDQEDEHIYYIESPSNLGYAKGNNLGLRKALDLGSTSAFVFNPDLLVDDLNILESICADVENDLRDVAVTYFKIHGQRVYYFRPLLIEIIFPFLKRFYSKNSRLKNDDIIYHGSGSCLLMNLDLVRRLEFFSEETFLFYEEAILAEKLRTTDFVTILYPNFEFEHLHSYSINKSFKTDKFVFMRDSLLFYLVRHRKLQKSVASVIAKINANFMMLNSYRKG